MNPSTGGRRQGRVAAAALPGQRGAGRAADAARRARPNCPPPSPRRCGTVARAPGRHRPDVAGERVRRAVRPAPPMLPAPELLHRRRHPQAGRGAGRVRRRVPERPASRSTGGELPDFLPAVLDLAAVHGAGLAAAARPPRRPGPARRRRWPGRASVYHHAVEAVRDHAARRPAGRPRRGRRAGPQRPAPGRGRPGTVRARTPGGRR